MTGSKSLLSSYSHAYLLAALLLLVGVQPFLYGAAIGSTVIRICLMINLVMAGFSCTAGRRELAGFAACVVPTIASGVLWSATDWDWAENLYFSLSAVTCVYVVVLIMLDIFRSTRVSANTICAALAIYLLLGLLWTYLFMVMEALAPGSFHFGDRTIDRSDAASLLRQLMGFSYTTLTTLGYGNITPTNPEADSLTSLEAIVGQIYLTVLVARLIGIQVSQDVDRQNARKA